jgi:acyl carrier protein
MTDATAPTADTIFNAIRLMVTRLLDEYGLDDIEITPESRLHDDLGLESIDLVTLGGMLDERYGQRVNLAEFLAELRIEDVIGLRLETLTDFVLRSLNGKVGTDA